MAVLCWFMFRQDREFIQEVTAASGRRVDVDLGKKIGIVTAQYFTANILQQYFTAV